MAAGYIAKIAWCTVCCIPNGGICCWLRARTIPRRRAFAPSISTALKGWPPGPPWKSAGTYLPADHPAFDLEAYYLAQVCVNALMTVSPERILLGGGVMQREGLLPRVRQYVRQLQNGYITAPELNDLDAYLQTPALYPLSGLVGAALLALSAR